MIRDILDETEGVREAFDELRRNFYAGGTRSAQFRKTALTALLSGYEQLEEDFNAALKADLGHNNFIANMQAHSLTKAEISDLIDGVGSWVKPESVPTPIGKGAIIQAWEWRLARSSRNHWEWHWSYPLGTTQSTPPSRK
jgi:hypothetical protein